MNVLRSSSRTVIYIHSVNSINSVGRRGIKRWVSPVLKEITRRKRKQTPQPVEARRAFLEWNREAEIWAFNQRLKENFDIDILTRALTHRSYVIKEEMERKKVGIDDMSFTIEDNKELIETGRNLTSKIVEIYLSLALPKAPEECILALHDHLLSEEMLANSASLIGTKDLILSEEYPPSSETLANTFLALVSALAQSVDEIHTGKFIRDFLIATLAERDLTELWHPEEPLKILNGILTRDGGEPAEPRLIAQSGVNSVLPVYQVGLYSKKEFLAAGTEDNVEGAVKIAALNALNDMFDLSQSRKPMQFNLTVDPSTQQMNNLPLHKWCTENVHKLIHRN
ncbi:39S ribosomal protein L44, mitochondrial [Fopius arisanus]|uniref:Large ribosomal subunit protein mL44 n=1 Tax=Fopius arisanus TaxID=64838 RepID=A0A0C9Q7A4_9HYME|nr:PREDICTED: 39S ribosomal protein L44, mitochondrial [Fopius arisanus]